MLICATAPGCAERADRPAAVALDASSGARSSPASPIVARVGEVAITRERALAEVGRLSPVLRREFRTRAGREEFLHAMVDRQLLLNEARRQGIHREPDVREQLRRFEEQLLVRTLMDRTMSEAIGDEALRAYYREHQDDFRVREAVKVARVLVRLAPEASEREIRAARRRLRVIARALRSGKRLAALDDRGDGPERDRGGDIGWVERGGGAAPALVTAAFALTAPGEVSDVIRVPEGLAIVQLLERRPARLRGFEEVREALRARFGPAHHRKAYDELLARLRAEGDFEVHADRLTEE